MKLMLVDSGLVNWFRINVSIQAPSHKLLCTIKLAAWTSQGLRYLKHGFCLFLSSSGLWLNLFWFVNRNTLMTLLLCVIQMVQLSLIPRDCQAPRASVHDQLNFSDWPVKRRDHWVFAPFYSLGTRIEWGSNPGSLLPESDVIPLDQQRSPVNSLTQTKYPTIYIP